MSTILAFTAIQAERLTGLTARRLTYWDETGVYRPAYKDDRPHRSYRRIYSFVDIVSLRTLKALKDIHRVSLDELRRTGQYLMRFTDTPWMKGFWVVERKVLFHHPESQQLVDRHGQTSYVDIDAIWAEVETETSSWTQRAPEDIGQIARHRHVQHNRWVIKGTRIPTGAVWNLHEAGYSAREIVEQYPNLSIEDVEAALTHESATRAA